MSGRRRRGGGGGERREERRTMAQEEEREERREKRRTMALVALRRSMLGQRNDKPSLPPGVAQPMHEQGMTWAESW